MIAAWAERGNYYRNWEWDLTCKDGSTRTISWSNLSELHPVPGWTAWGIGIDVTEHNQTKLALNRCIAELERRIAEYRSDPES